MSSTQNTTGSAAASDGFTSGERAAMKDRAKELKSKRGSKKSSSADDEAAVLEKIPDMPGADRAIAERLHSIITAVSPDLAPKTWYGMPAYARDGKTICFFQPASKFKARYSTLGFSDAANIDDGEIFPTVFAIIELNDAVEKQISELVTRALS